MGKLDKDDEIKTNAKYNTFQPPRLEIVKRCISGAIRDKVTQWMHCSQQIVKRRRLGDGPAQQPGAQITVIGADHVHNEWVVVITRNVSPSSQFHFEPSPPLNGVGKLSETESSRH